MLKSGIEVYKKVAGFKSLHNLLLIECMVASCIDEVSNELGTYIDVVVSRDDSLGRTSYFEGNVVTILNVQYNEIVLIVQYLVSELNQVGGYRITTDICDQQTYVENGSDKVMKISWMWGNESWH